MSAVIEQLPALAAGSSEASPIRIDPNAPLFAPWAVAAMAAIVADQLNQPKRA